MDNTSIEASSSINKIVEDRDHECFLFFFIRFEYISEMYIVIFGFI